jgi:hypothetical protein
MVHSSLKKWFSSARSWPEPACQFPRNHRVCRISPHLEELETRGLPSVPATLSTATK